MYEIFILFCDMIILHVLCDYDLFHILLSFGKLFGSMDCMYVYMYHCWHHNALKICFGNFLRLGLIDVPFT
jgi:hypothetical protein